MNGIYNEGCRKQLCSKDISSARANLEQGKSILRFHSSTLDLARLKITNWISPDYFQIYFFQESHILIYIKTQIRKDDKTNASG